MEKRLYWLDLMKVFGMYLIVLGHIGGVVGMSFIFVFHVPLFFIISGFLTKKEESTVLCCKKIIHRMLLPSFIWLLPMTLIWGFESLQKGTTSASYISSWLLGICGGGQASLGVMWFIYTLAVCKIIFQAFNGMQRENLYQIIVCITFIGITQYLNYKELYFNNAMVDTLIAYPLFVIGSQLRHFKNTLDKIKPIPLFFIFVVALMLTLVAYKFNGAVFLYKNQVGSVLLCLIGGVSGTAFIYAISIFFAKEYRWLQDMSNGTLVILGLHPIILWIVNRFYPMVLLGNYNFISALVIMLVSYLVILICKSKFRFLIGV